MPHTPYPSRRSDQDVAEWTRSAAGRPRGPPGVGGGALGGGGPRGRHPPRQGCLGRTRSSGAQPSPPRPLSFCSTLAPAGHYVFRPSPPTPPSTAPDECLSPLSPTAVLCRHPPPTSPAAAAAWPRNVSLAAAPSTARRLACVPFAFSDRAPCLVSWCSPRGPTVGGVRVGLGGGRGWGGCAQTVGRLRHGGASAPGRCRRRAVCWGRSFPGGVPTWMIISHDAMAAAASGMRRRRRRRAHCVGEGGRPPTPGQWVLFLCPEVCVGGTPRTHSGKH